MATYKEILEKYNKFLTKTILQYQNPITGLLPPFINQDGIIGGEFHGHAWVRDNVYCALAIWGMSLAYKRQGEGERDRQRGDELEKNVVKLMRSILQCMLGQVNRVESFKKSLGKEHSLHAKYNISTCGPVVGDHDWGHLQIDATSLFLLVLAQLTSAGLRIVFTLDEVAFIQNLIFYIETAYRTPDYGIWERGDKTNHGQTELNATSIGMAKAALEAMSGLDLFGAQGSPSSVICVLADQVAQCNAKLISLLPRESSSKEIDAGLLTIIGFPAFAVESTDIIEETRDQIINKLLGNYGCRRFLRDGYQTVKEDSSRLHYEPAELKIFENIECEWPLFLVFLLIDSVINNYDDEIIQYRQALNKIVIRTDELQTLPELFYVPWENVDAEYREPHSQTRKPGRKILYMWAQSMYILAGLLEEGLVNIGEIDPLNRRLSTLPRPDPLVQVVLLAEDDRLCEELKQKGISSQTIAGVEKDPNCAIGVFPAKMLGEAYTYLGISKKMGLTGRILKRIGVLSTSMLYCVKQEVFAFYPSFLDHEAFYLCLDNELLVDVISTDIAYLKSNWNLMGCPTVTLPILRTMLGETSSWDKSPMLKFLQTLKSGYIAGVRVQLRRMSDFISTSYLVHMAFLESLKTSIWSIEQAELIRRRSTVSIIQIDLDDEYRPRTHSVSSPVAGAVRRSREIPTSLQKTKGFTKIATSPSFGRLQVAKGWSARRHSYVGGKLSVDIKIPSDANRRIDSVMDSLNVQDLIEELKGSSDLYEQTDILHFLFNKYGKDFDTNIDGQKCTVEILLQELYEKVGFYKVWSLVRHSAGMLMKTVDDIEQVATDLLVRQKNFSMGQPNHEIQITQPLPRAAFLEKIHLACGKDYSAISLTQEILVYLAMFIRSEPHLFQEMLRLRIGLIQNVMVTELSRALQCSNEEGLERLLDLGPYELKNLLYHILSRKEFAIDDQGIGDVQTSDMRQLSIFTHKKHLNVVRLHKYVRSLSDMDGDEEDEGEKQGQWRRRRRIDGALNRVPQDFYFQVWHTLEQCEGISIGSKHLPRNPTVHEMTPGELKFAVRVESVLNSLPNPEYRQLIVEVLMVCGIWVRLNPQEKYPHVMVLDNVISCANQLFLEDQRANNGLAMKCCCGVPGLCEGYGGVCVFFYDSAPSGMYGTMSYFARAMLQNLAETIPQTHACRIS